MLLYMIDLTSFQTRTRQKQDGGKKQIDKMKSERCSKKKELGELGPELENDNGLRSPAVHMVHVLVRREDSVR